MGLSFDTMSTTEQGQVERFSSLPFLALISYLRREEVVIGIGRYFFLINFSILGSVIFAISAGFQTLRESDRLKMTCQAHSQKIALGGTSYTKILVCIRGSLYLYVFSNT